MRWNVPSRLATGAGRRRRRRPSSWVAEFQRNPFSTLAPFSAPHEGESAVEAQKRAAAAPERPHSGYDADSLRALGVVKRSMLLGARTVLLTGAGFSTESGVPDYRSQKGSYSKGHKPMQHQEFLAKGRKGEANRRRYWARSVIGWTHMDGTLPNSGHYDAAKLQAAGYLEGGIITQNVDGLHTVAGAKDVAELHGNLHEVVCSGEGGCGWRGPRSDYQHALVEANREWIEKYYGGMGEIGRLAFEDENMIRSDGDANVRGGQEAYDSFQYLPCPNCGGVHGGKVKPDVVFLYVSEVLRSGDSVAKAKVEECRRRVLSSDLLLIVGTSLQVYSAYRFARYAAGHGINGHGGPRGGGQVSVTDARGGARKGVRSNNQPGPVEIAIFNMGETRADDLATHRASMLATDCMAALRALAH